MPEKQKKTAKSPKTESKRSDLDFRDFLKDFDFSKLSINQWGILLGGAFLFVYIMYNFVWADPTPVAQTTLSTPTQATNSETEEQKFKRENKNTSLPDGKTVSQKIIDEETQLTQQIPFGDKEMEFRVRLPKTWVMSEFARYGLPGEENYRVLTNVARYFGPAIEDMRPFMWVEVQRLKRYVSAETWARAYMIKRGISPEAIVVDSTTNVQALYVDVRDSRSYAVRALFKIEGDTVILVTYGVPLQIYKESKDMMGLTLGSFELLHHIDRQIEEVKNFRLLNIIKFKYYVSWLPRNPFTESTLRPSVELHNLPEVIIKKGDNTLQGFIRVDVRRKNKQFSEQQNMQEILDRLQELRMIIKQPLDKPKSLKLFSNFTRAVQTPYIAQVNTYMRSDQFDIIKSEESKTNQEVWITTLDNDYYVVYLTLVTPMQTTSYLAWAQNMAAYKLLMDTIDLKGAPITD